MASPSIAISSMDADADGPFHKNGYEQYLYSWAEIEKYFIMHLTN